MTPTPTRADKLRADMVGRIKDAGHARSERLEQALRTVPRHLLVPDATLENAYANQTITIKRGAERPASCASVPTIVAMMLGQLDVQPGDHVLEIGAGSGYNAALLAELVGSSGQVTTLDIDPDVTAHARAALDETGYDHVRVITRDGFRGADEFAPFDRIIVTVGPWDLPSAWFTQLADKGRLVVPLHWRSQARSVAFTKEDGVLRSQDSQLCGFIPMVGLTPAGEQKGEITPEVLLYWDGDQPIHMCRLRTVFTHPGMTTWSGVTVAADEPLDLIWLGLTATDPATCRLAATNTAIEDGLCQPIFPERTPALAEGESLTYLTSRRAVDRGGSRRHELGAIAHGPAAEKLARRLCAQIQAWNHNRTAQPEITAYRADTHDDALDPGLLIDKYNTRMGDCCKIGVSGPTRRAEFRRDGHCE